jgi:hypothetical protein
MPANTPHVGRQHPTQRKPSRRESETKVTNIKTRAQEGGIRRAERHMTAAEAEKYLDGSWRIRIVK